jgi:hypothetical protein
MLETILLIEAKLVKQDEARPRSRREGAQAAGPQAL